MERMHEPLGLDKRWAQSRNSAAAPCADPLTAMTHSNAIVIPLPEAMRWNMHGALGMQIHRQIAGLPAASGQILAKRVG